MLVSANKRRTTGRRIDGGIITLQGAVMGEGLAVQPTKLDTTAIDAAQQRRAERTVVKVEEVLSGFAERDFGGEILTAVRRFPARAAEFAEWPEWLEERLRAVYRAKGIARP